MKCLALHFIKKTRNKSAGYITNFRLFDLFTYDFITYMKKKCENCATEMQGRTDKRFCSTRCKNEKNNALRQNTREVTKEIDGYLHRNREILALLMGQAKKETFDRLILTRAGFRFEFMTSIYTNKEGKTYYIVYDYAWMEFSDLKVLIVRKTKK